MAKRYIIVDPDGEAVYNHVTSNHLFLSPETARQAAIDLFGEPDGENMETGEITTLADELGWDINEFRIFKEV